MAMAMAAPDAAQEFLSEGLISEVLAPLKSGKEATTYLCRAPKRSGRRLAVLKVYHERTRRNFANAAIYQEGRVILDARARRAVHGKSEAGQRFESALWVDHEFDVMATLYDAGLDVPEPIACNEGALLMGYVGESENAAPQLGSASLPPAELAAFRDRVLWNVEAMLGANVIHADLSAFNILAWQGRPVIIDFPQAVDPRFSGQARALLQRDLRNVERYFRRLGHGFDAEGLAVALWDRWRLGELG
jgi:RIO kinase 1